MALFPNLNVNYCLIQVLYILILARDTFSYHDLSLNSKLCQLDYEIGLIEMEGDEAIWVKDEEYFSSWTGRYEYSCKFTVKVKDRNRRDEGIYAVIQDLNFRQKENGDCLDYVEFSIPKWTSKLMGLRNKSPKRFCGNLSPGMWLQPAPLELFADSSALFEYEVGPNAYVSSDEEIAVKIFIARERLTPGQRLVVSIAFTPYRRRCHRLTDQIECRPGECINHSLEMDGVQNCPYLSCADETGCRALRKHHDESEWPKDLIGSGIGAKVTFGAVAGIILLLLKFFLCLWLCKRISRRRRAPPQHEIRHVVAPTTDPEPPIILPPSAPPIADIDNKDMPPSYDSLFPHESLPLEDIGGSRREERDTVRT